MHLNTAMSALMELVNESTRSGAARLRPAGRDDEPPAVITRPETAAVLREALEALILMLSPFTPHLSEELWERLRAPRGRRRRRMAGVRRGGGAGRGNRDSDPGQREGPCAYHCLRRRHARPRSRPPRWPRPSWRPICRTRTWSKSLWPRAPREHRREAKRGRHDGTVGPAAAGRVGLAGRVVSCGYALAGRGNALPATIKIIGVPQFVNQSTSRRSIAF